MYACNKQVNISSCGMPAKVRSHCPIAYALGIFGDRWTLLVVRDLLFKRRRRFNEFLDAGEGIASNVLAERLTRLSSEGVVVAQADADDGRVKLYSLTEKGLDLAPLLVEMILWSAAHDGKSAADQIFVRRARKDRKVLLEEIRAANRGSS